MKGTIVAIGCLLGMTIGARAEEVVLENEFARLVFSGSEKYAFKSFVMEGSEILPDDGSDVYPWEMTFLGPKGETPRVDSDHSFYKGCISSSSAAIFNWEVMLDGQPWTVSVEVSLKEDSDLPEWILRAELPEGWVVTEAEFPRISIARPDDAKVVYPASYGAETAFGPSSLTQIEYPSGNGCMQLLLMHHGEGTVYMAAADRQGCSKYLSLTGQGKSALFSQKVVTSWEWSEGGHFALPWATVMAFTTDSWQDAALRWYRPFSLETEWGSKTVSERRISKWVKNTDIWLRPLGVGTGTMSALRKCLGYFGDGVGLHWYYWHKHDFDTNYPDYFPAKEGFAAMIEEAQGLGAHVLPYINGRLWDPSNDSYAAHGGPEASCRKTDGTLYTEVYSSKVYSVVCCPSSTPWQEVITHCGRQLVNELKADGVYLDQVGCAPAEPCYADGHPHAKGGGCWWHRSYRSMVSRMGKKGTTFATEENAECYIDIFDVMLIVNSPHNQYTHMVPLFPLIYSDRAIYAGYTYIPWRMDNGSADFMAMKSLLWGSQLGWIDPLRLVNYPDQAAFLRTLAEFRAGQHDLFVGGRFLGEFVPGGDNHIKSVPDYEQSPVVMGAKWRSVNGSEAYIMVNSDGRDRIVETPDGVAHLVPAKTAVRIDIE